jgi:hypothetical protein
MKEFNLSDRINIDINLLKQNDDLIKVKDVKEKVQNSKKKLKESINSESLYSLMAKDWVIKEIDKIFFEEFGDKLI